MLSGEGTEQRIAAQRSSSMSGTQHGSMGEQREQPPPGGELDAYAFLRAAARRPPAEAVQGMALALRRELAVAMGEGLTTRTGEIRRTGYSQNRQDG